MAEEPELGIRHDDKGIHAVGPLDDGERVRVVVREEQLDNTDEPTLRDLSEALIAVRGTDYKLHSATWISRFTDMTRQAAFYRERRVLLAAGPLRVFTLLHDARPVLVILGESRRPRHHSMGRSGPVDRR